jgi:hypothetical protein
MGESRVEACGVEMYVTRSNWSVAVCQGGCGVVRLL